MANESSKSRPRRIAEGVFTRILTSEGKGIDIGCGTDPVTPNCDQWDIQNGDAQTMGDLKEESYDWVYSSHCLEHLVSPKEAIARWWSLVKPGGYLFVVVPDEDLYEQGVWPSQFNHDHKHTFTVSKSCSWSPVSVNIVDIVTCLDSRKIISLRTVDAGYNYSGGVWDRTLNNQEANIEVIIQKQV